MSSIQDLQARAIAVQQKYRELNKKQGHDAWDVKDYAMGLAGDVGDLMKLVMAKDNKRAADDLDAKLTHELMDVLWCIFVLAKEYNIDIDTAFTKAMDELDARIRESTNE